jgi:cytochrome P450
VITRLGAANRDSTAFTSPDDLILERDDGADHRPSVEPAPAAATGATGASIR